MKYRKLGNTDIDVSVICLGTMTFGEQNSQQDGFDQMDYAVERGVNFFDTAELYAVMPRKDTYGKTEEIVGNWFQEKKNRDKIILASKIASKSDGLEWIREGSKNLGFDKKMSDQHFFKFYLDSTISTQELASFSGNFAYKFAF